MLCSWSGSRQPIGGAETLREARPGLFLQAAFPATVQELCLPTWLPPDWLLPPPSVPPAPPSVRPTSHTMLSKVRSPSLPNGA